MKIKIKNAKDNKSFASTNLLQNRHANMLSALWTLFLERRRDILRSCIALQAPSPLSGLPGALSLCLGQHRGKPTEPKAHGDTPVLKGACCGPGHTHCSGLHILPGDLGPYTQQKTVQGLSACIPCLLLIVSQQNFTMGFA